MAHFITLEGIEGAGKSTAALALAARLAQRGLAVKQTREPGGTPLAERLRQIVLERGAERLSAQTETLLMFAARAVHVDNLIRPALASGTWIVCDRFTDATRAYQGGGRGVSLTWIETLQAEVLHGFEAERTLLFDLPVSLGLERTRERAGATDRFEAERPAFFERVRATYLELARAAPSRIRLIDASRPAADVLEQCLAALADWI